MTLRAEMPRVVQRPAVSLREGWRLAEPLLGTQRLMEPPPQAGAVDPASGASSHRELFPNLST